MLAYYISGSNGFTIRTSYLAPASDGSYNFGYLGLQNMTTLENSVASLTNLNYKPYESLLSFTASIDKAIVGGEYRAVLYSGNQKDILWNGSIQVYTSQSVDKPNYTNQIPLEGQYKSNVTENRYKEYIIM